MSKFCIQYCSGLKCFLLYFNNEQRSAPDQSANDDDHADAEEGDEPVTFVEVGLGVGLVGRVHRQKNDDRRRHDEGAKPPEVPSIVSAAVTKQYIPSKSKKTDDLDDRSSSKSKRSILLLKPG